MKAIYALGLMLTFSVACYGQQPGTSLNAVNPNEPPPEPTGQRLQYLLRNAYESEQIGNLQQAAVFRLQADHERQALLRRIDALQAEIDQIRQATGAGAQVIVKIQVFEVSLTKLRKLGFDWTKLTGNSTAATNLVPSSLTMNDGSEPLPLIEKLRKENLVKVLAEPTLVTTSGRKGEMHGGSEFPVPKLQPDGTTAIEWQYDMNVEVTPVVLGDKINMEFRIRLAEPDYAHTVRVGNDTVPGIRRRECNTAAMFKNGQPLVIRGLVYTREESENSGVPVLSNIPYAGVPFRKVTTTRNELALIVVVRPEIMQASPAAVSPTPSVQGMAKPLSTR